MIAQDANQIAASFRHDGVQDPIELRNDSLDIDFGYLEAVSITDGETPWHYDAVALAWSPDGGITEEHEIVTDVPVDVLVEAVVEFLQREAEQQARMDSLLDAMEVD